MPVSSIRLRLLLWLILPLVAITLIGAFVTFWQAWIPARDAYDLELTDAAIALAASLQADESTGALRLPPEAERVLRADAFAQIYFAALDGTGMVIAGDSGLPRSPVKLLPGASIHYDGSYGGKALRLSASSRVVDGRAIDLIVGETLAKQERVKKRVFSAIVVSNAALIIATIALALLAVNRSLRPLTTLSDALAVRSHKDLTPLGSADVPSEVEPFVASINGLLGRISVATNTQQQFLADVAHQLRTPLAGLTTQLSVLKQYTLSAELERIVSVLENSVDRSSRLVNQLLALARAEPSRFDAARLQPLPLSKLVEQAVETWLARADEKSIDLGADVQPASAWGDAFLLREMLDNLVANAIQYTPNGGSVTIGCTMEAKDPVLFVEDSGPGIPMEQRERVFERFYRLSSGSGSGLGLAIVRDIVNSHAAQVRIDTPMSGAGTRVSVRFVESLATATEAAITE